MSKVLLICNGEKPGNWLRKIAKEADFIVAADGGANAALACEIRPDVIIGDLDSVSSRTKHAFQDGSFIHVKRQDNTDLEKALDWITAQHFEQCTIVGATGGRLDFTLGNILSALAYIGKIRLEFRAKNWRLLPLTKSYRFTAPKGTRCSFIPITSCRNVTLKGVKYRVTNENWDLCHIGRTLSNEITASASEIIFSKGMLLLYLEK